MTFGKRIMMKAWPVLKPQASVPAMLKECMVLIELPLSDSCLMASRFGAFIPAHVRGDFGGMKNEG